MFALVGPAVAILTGGVVAGLTYGVAAGDIADRLGSVLGVAAAQLPAIWLLAGIAVALFGVAPRFTSVAWAVLVAFVAIYFLGSIAGIPHWLTDLVPFSHTQRIPGTPLAFAPVVWLLVIDAALIAAGLAAFRRRDLS